MNYLQNLDRKAHSARSDFPTLNNFKELLTAQNTKIINVSDVKNFFIDRFLFLTIPKSNTSVLLGNGKKTLMVWLDDLKHLCQPKQFYDKKIRIFKTTPSK